MNDSWLESWWENAGACWSVLFISCDGTLQPVLLFPGNKGCSQPGLWKQFISRFCLQVTRRANWRSPGWNVSSLLATEVDRAGLEMLPPAETADHGSPAAGCKCSLNQGRGDGPYFSLFSYLSSCNSLSKSPCLPPGPCLSLGHTAAVWSKINWILSPSCCFIPAPLFSLEASLHDSPVFYLTLPYPSPSLPKPNLVPFSFPVLHAFSLLLMLPPPSLAPSVSPLPNLASLPSVHLLESAFHHSQSYLPGCPSRCFSTQFPQRPYSPRGTTSLPLF